MKFAIAEKHSWRSVPKWEWPVRSSIQRRGDETPPAMWLTTKRSQGPRCEVVSRSQPRSMAFGRAFTLRLRPAGLLRLHRAVAWAWSSARSGEKVIACRQPSALQGLTVATSGEQFHFGNDLRQDTQLAQAPADCAQSLVRRARRRLEGRQYFRDESGRVRNVWYIISCHHGWGARGTMPRPSRRQ